MKWTKHKSNSFLIQYPLFNSYQRKFSHLEELSKEQAELELYNDCVTFLKTEDKESLISRGNYSSGAVSICSGRIWVYVSTWCGNTGYGRYSANGSWKKYHYINGMFLRASSISNTYCIMKLHNECDFEDTIKYALILIERHCRRFIREYNK